MSGYLGPQPVPQATQHRQTVTATAGLTSITTSGYQPGYVDVYMNGVKLVNGTDYTATDGASITLASAANANDIIEIIANVPFQLVGMTFTGTTTFNGQINMPTWTTAGRPSSPQVGTAGYNTTLGTLESWNGSSWQTGGGLVMQSVQTTSFTAVAGNSYPINTTSGAVTATLPASATAGQQVNFFDYAGTAGTNAITINFNGGKINGYGANAVISAVRASVTLIYVDSTQGWVDLTIGNAASVPFVPYSASYLIVAGGGGGYYADQNNGTGGGGAGGLLSGTTTVTPGTTYSFTVGAGGAGGGGGAGAVNGSSSTGLSLTAIGGGLGSGVTNNAAGSGGSGGGGDGYTQFPTPGSGTTGQGYAGGYGSNTASYPRMGGGGGGAGAVGGNYSGSTGGAGGIGAINSLITTTQATANSVGQVSGASVYFAGGGGGSSSTGTGGAGGLGGGGAGGSSGAGVAGSVNSGGGAGGSSNNAASRSGGSGVVILLVPTTSYTGFTTGSPTVVTNGANTVMIFKSSGSYTA